MVHHVALSFSLHRQPLASNQAPSGSLLYWIARKGRGGQYKYISLFIAVVRQKSE